MGAVDRRYDAGGLAAADRDQPRRRIPVGEALPAGDAQDRRRLGHHDVVAGGPARRGRVLPAIARPRAASGCSPRRSRWNARPFGDGIRVNSVHPGIIDTPIWGKIPTEAAGRGQNAPIDPEERAKLATPLARAGQAAEIAQGVLYLASDASRYVTGTELVIDGGMNAGGVARGRN